MLQLAFEFFCLGIAPPDGFNSKWEFSVSKANPGRFNLELNLIYLLLLSTKDKQKFKIIIIKLFYL